MHRAVPLDYVGVKRFDADGAVVGECRFTGLYTSTVYSEPDERIPVVRRKVAEVIAASGFRAASHDGRALVNILETYPRDELFRLSTDRLTVLALGILRMGDRRRLRLFAAATSSAASCRASCTSRVTATRPRCGSAIVFTLQRAFHGTDVDFTVLVTESVLARLHVIVDTPDRDAPVVDVAALEAELAAHRARVGRRPARRARRRARRGGRPRHVPDLRDAFLPAYQEDVRPRRRSTTSRCSRRPTTSRSASRARPTVTGRAARSCTARAPRSLLSAVMPVLEHLGLIVVDERPYQVTAAGGAPRWVDTFRVRLGDGDQLDDPDAQARVAELFLGVWAGEIENDWLNRLVLRAGLAAREVVLLRALVKYLRQAGVRFTEASFADALAANPRRRG